MEAQAIKNFQEYLRIKTVHPSPDYNGAVVFLQKMAAELDLPCDVFWCVPEKKPAVIMKWTGTEPSLPSLMLNSHIDVVPVYPEYWSYDPFSATRTEEGNIYARGSQDMKCVGIQYIEAVRRLKIVERRRFKRTIYLTFVPDEEISGEFGMEIFAASDYFKKMNVGFALDEGLANPTEAFTLFYGERSPWWMEFKCQGNAGHGSKFIENTAAQKIRNLIDRFMGYRDSEEKRLKNNPNLKLGDVTTVNMTMLSGGVQPNVVPSELSVTFDMRVTPTRTMEEVEAQVLQWKKEAGSDIEIVYHQKTPLIPAVKPTRDNPWFHAFYKATEDLELKIEEEIFPAGTDSRFLRQQGIPALGFSPMNHTPVLLHDHDEFLNDKIFLRGIEIYMKILPSLAES